MSGQLCNPFCNPEMLKDLEKSRTIQIAPDIWMIEGYMGSRFWIEPPSGNSFVLRDGDLVVMMDTGHHPHQREGYLRLLRKLREEGARELVLTMSHGHWDHGKNNDVIYEAGYERVRFLLAEPELHTLNIPGHMIGDFKKTMPYMDAFTPMAHNFRQYMEWCKQFKEFDDPQYRETWALLGALNDKSSLQEKLNAFESLVRRVLAPDISTYMIDKAEPLSLKDREKRTFGDVTVQGWPVGRFFLIHDASQSPGHCLLYDPKNKFIITGDMTLEINPSCFFDCSLDNCLTATRNCLRMAQQEDILIASDMHRSSQWWPMRLKEWNVEPLAPVQVQDYARGSEQCAAFYKMFEDYYTDLRKETIKTHERMGEATIPEITAELAKSDNKNVKFLYGIAFPHFPSRPPMLVLEVMLTSGATRKGEGAQTRFTPARR